MRSTGVPLCGRGRGENGGKEEREKGDEEQESLWENKRGNEVERG